MISYIALLSQRGRSLILGLALLLRGHEQADKKTCSILDRSWWRHQWPLRGEVKASTASSGSFWHLAGPSLQVALISARVHLQLYPESETYQSVLKSTRDLDHSSIKPRWHLKDTKRYASGRAKAFTHAHRMPVGVSETRRYCASVCKRIVLFLAQTEVRLHKIRHIARSR